MSIIHCPLSIEQRRSGRPAGLGEGLRLPLAWLPGGPSAVLCLLAAAMFIVAGVHNRCRAAEFAATLAAIRHVESAGYDRAVGDGGRSRGPYQIRRAYWREAVAGTDAAGWDYDKHVWDPARAEYVVWLHWNKVSPAALAAGRAEELARRHRLPYAPWRADNDAYWVKVKAAMGRVKR